MAGIGFELKKFLRQENYLGLIGAYGYAGLICSGPWLLSIMTILMLALIAKMNHLPIEISRIFQMIVVYVIAGSLIISSFFQHSYTRYIANQCYLHRQSQVVPSLNSVFLVSLIIAACVGFLFVQTFTPSLTSPIKCVIVSCFAVLSLVWISTSVLSGLLAYKTIFAAFLSYFITTLVLGSAWLPYGLVGMLASFLVGQFLLLMILIFAIYKSFPTNEMIHFDFFNFKNTRKILIFTGLFYNLGIWVDKFIFWYNPITGVAIIDHLHASFIYDAPIFLAYLMAIPGMAIFLLNMETTYTDAHQRFYDYLSGNQTLDHIQTAYADLVEAGLLSIMSAIKSQAFMLLVGLTLGSTTFTLLHLPLIYLPLFTVCLIASGLNVILWATLDIIFYLDRLETALIITAIFLFSNIAFSLLSIKLGIFFYGFGLVASLFLSVLVSYLLLNRIVYHLQYETYMLRN